MKKTLLLIAIISFLVSGCGTMFPADKLEKTAGPPSAPSPWKKSGVVVQPKLSTVGVKINSYTVANLPTPSASQTETMSIVTDGADEEDCTTGGGSAKVLCYWTGSAWANLGDGQAAGSAEVQDELFTALNYNGDTTHAQSQDDFHDIWVQIDSDLDNSFADETWLTTYMTEAEFTSTIGASYDTSAELDALFAAKQDNLTFGIADTNALQVDATAGAPNDDEIARFTASGIEGLTYAELATATESANEGVIDLQDLQGAVTDAQVPDTITVNQATLATTVTVSDDESSIDNQEVVFTTDNTNLESDGDLNYNPSTGTLSATVFSGTLAGTNLDIANTTTEASIASNDLIIIYDVTAAANRAMTRGNFVSGIGAGQAITFDIGDDGGDDSTDLGEIATTGDTNSIFTEPSADKMLINLGNNWPAADLAVTLTITDNEATAETNAVIFTAGGALTGGNLGLESDGDLTYTPSTGTLAATEFSGGGSGLTAVDAATGDSATAFFDAGTIEHERGGFEADVSLYNGLIRISGGTTSNITDAAGLETALSLGAYASDILGAADSDALVTLLGLVAGDIPDLSATYEVVDAEIARFDTADTVGADWEWQDGIAMSFGNDNDWEVAYDELTDDRLEYTHTAGAGADVYWDLNDNLADSLYTITNSDATYEANVSIEGDLSLGGVLTVGSSGDSYITLSNNASIVGSGYQILFEAGNLVSVENGSEKTVLNESDGATLTGTTWDFTGTTNFLLPTAADAAGEIAIDTTAHQLQYHDSGGTVITFDSDADAAGYVWKSDGSGNFTLQADATGGSPTWDSVADPSAGTSQTITFDADNEETIFDYTAAFTVANSPTLFRLSQNTGNAEAVTLFQVDAADSNVIAAKIGNTTDYWQVSQAGVLSNASGATIDIAAASDLLIGGGQIAFDDIASASANLGANALTVNSVEIVGSDGEVNAAAIEDAYLSNTGDVGTGVYDFGGSTTFEIWNSTTDMALGAAGQIGIQVTDDQLVFHGGAAGEIQGEAAKYLGEKLTMVFDPSDAYDQESTYRVLPLPPLGDDAPEGITITEWNLNYVGGDPTTELDADLMCDTTPDYNPAAGATVMDVLDTTAGASNADTGFDSATCANGSNMYIRFGADPTDANVMIEFTLWYYAEED